MRWYLILGSDRPGTLAARLQARSAHLERLHALQAEGRLKLAGPLPAVDAVDPGDAGFTGSAMVVAFDTIEEARSWAAADPYAAAGVFDSIAVFPFKPVLP